MPISTENSNFIWRLAREKKHIEILITSFTDWLIINIHASIQLHAIHLFTYTIAA